MKIGANFFVTSKTIDPTALGRALEEAGFDSFWAPEHGTLPAEPSTPYATTGGAIPDVYGQMVDPFVLLSFMAAATSSLKMATGVCLVPEHHPLILAKAVSTLDQFSGGRVVFGVGTGWLREVTELFTPHAATPWKYTIEAVEAMRALWRDGVASYTGDLISFPKVICDPTPRQRPHPPVIVGAQPTPVAFKRIAAWGDGWLATGLTPEQVAAGRSAITAECKRIGRDPATVEITVGVRDARPEIQRRYEDAGADRLLVHLYNHPARAIPMDEWPAVLAVAMASPPPTPAATLKAIEVIHDLAGM